MNLAFLLVNGSLGTIGGYLVFKRFRHLGLLAAGVTLTIASFASLGDENWWIMLGGTALAAILFRLIGDPIEG